jgi:hypothetical protein
MRAGTSGDWETGKGSTTPISFSTLSAGLSGSGATNKIAYWSSPSTVSFNNITSDATGNLSLVNSVALNTAAANPNDDQTLWIDSADNHLNLGTQDLMPLTTVGDLYVYNASGPNRLPVGTDGQILVADSGETFGVTWSDNTGASTQTFLSGSGTVLLPLSVSTLRATLVGGGGGGGGGGNLFSIETVSGGGGAGAVIHDLILKIDGSSTLIYEVGVGGSGSDGGDGSDGGNTILVVAGATFTAYGGGGGDGSNGTNESTTRGGGGGSGGSKGDNGGSDGAGGIAKTTFPIKSPAGGDGGVGAAGNGSPGDQQFYVISGGGGGGPGGSGGLMASPYAGGAGATNSGGGAAGFGGNGGDAVYNGDGIDAVDNSGAGGGGSGGPTGITVTGGNGGSGYITIEYW